MIFAWDIETSGLNPWAEDARILSMATWDIKGGVASAADDDDWRWIGDALYDPGNRVYGHNILGFDVPYAEAHGTEIRCKLFDTRVAQALLDETGEANSLAALAHRYCGIELDTGMKAKRGTLAEVPVEDLLQYNLDDARASWEVGQYLELELEKRDLMPLMEWLMVVGRVLANMIGRGVIVDRQWVSEKGIEVSRDIERLHREINEAVGRRPDIPEEFRPDGVKPTINLASGAQLRELIFEELEVDPELVPKTKGGQPSLSESAVLELARTFKKGPVRDWFAKIIDWRGLTKLRGTYLEPLVGKHLGTDGKVHTVYHLGRGYGARGKQGGTVTGRLSSSEPNLQNIPRDFRVKGAFVPSAGKRLFDADYAQLELRVAAWYSQEEQMLTAFDEGKDIHTAALAQIEERDYQEVVELIEVGDKHWNEQRALIKRINFGVLYGASAYKIRELLRDMGVDVSYHKAETMVKKWFHNYASLSAWITTVENEIKMSQQVTTPTGRVRHLPEVLSPNGGQRAGALRQGVNFMVQSLASDVTLTALENIEHHFFYQGHAQLLMTVHDSVVGEYEPDKWDESHLRFSLEQQMVKGVNKKLDERFGIQPLPLAIDVATGLRRWGEK